MAKKAYMILAHKNFKQVARLISALEDGQSHFFLHVDVRVPKEQYAFLLNDGHCVSLAKGVDARWGSIGAVFAAISAMRAVRESGKSFDHIILLSGQDYPIKSTQEINAFFDNSSHRVFVDNFRLPCPDRWNGGGMFRVNKYYCGETRWNKLQAKLMNFPGKIYKPLMRHLPKRLGHIAPYGGSQWFSIDEPAMRFILDFVDANPDYARFMRYTYVVDEVFFSTLLRNAPAEIQATISDDNLRFIKWEHKFSKHPLFFNAGDIDRIAASSALYARKFDETMDDEIFDLIDQRCLNRAPAAVH